MVSTKKHLKIFLLLFLLITIIVSTPLTVNAACGKDCTTDHALASGLCSLCGHYHDLSSMAGIEKSAYEADKKELESQKKVLTERKEKIESMTKRKFNNFHTRL